jgi:hypothetical protein
LRGAIDEEHDGAALVSEVMTVDEFAASALPLDRLSAHDRDSFASYIVAARERRAS